MNIAMKTLAFLVFKSGNTQLELTLDRFESAVELWLQGNYENAVKEFNRISTTYRDRRMGNLTKKPLAYGYDRCQYYNGLESTKERLESIDQFVIDNRGKPMAIWESYQFANEVEKKRNEFQLWYRDSFGSRAEHTNKKRNAIKLKWFCREMRKIQKIFDTRENFK